MLAIQREIVIDKRELQNTDVGPIIKNELRQVQDSLRGATKMSDVVKAQVTAQAEKVQKRLEQANIKKEWDLIRYQRGLLRWEVRYSILARQAQENEIGFWEIAHRLRGACSWDIGCTSLCFRWPRATRLCCRY